LVKKKGIWIIVIIVIVILAAYFVYRSAAAPSDNKNLAQCLTDKGVSMAGTDRCTHCADQKEMFGKAFKYINYRNCDFEIEWCFEHGVTGYPTWVFPDSTTYPGVRSLSELKRLAGC